jgi:probable rRNA maturation factor
MLQYHYEAIEWRLPLEDDTSFWLTTLVSHFGYTIQEVNYIFGTDESVAYLNDKYLGHNEFTDILTFNYTPENKKQILADIYISIERVQENAAVYGVPFIDELHRVMAHGLLHIVGFNDQTDAEEAEMRQQEEYALNLRMF